MRYSTFDGNTDLVEYESTNDVAREVMKKLLARRGLTKKEEIQDFLQPEYAKWVKDPIGIKGMEEGANRVVDAMKHGEKICIYSDYDCDGIPGGVLLSDFFDHLGYTNRIHYIPHRHKEGYGINKPSIDKLKKEGVALMVTVDNGITNNDEVKYAQDNGIDVIVTDHHLPLREEAKGKSTKNKMGKQILPKGFVVINSKRDDCTYHDDMLCGCAVAWKLACAVLAKLRAELENKSDKKKVKNISPLFTVVLKNVAKTKDGWEKWWLDLVAISTIADMVPLQKENRALAYFGMKVLQKSSRPGLQKLLALTKTKQDKITAQDIAFTIAPRINASSRMGDPITAYHMLRNKLSAEAINAAEELEALNQLRKDTVKGIKHEVMGYDLDLHTHVVVIGNESWGPGVLGLIAQEVFDETGKPTFVWGMGEQENEYKGSCRAPEHVNLVELMSACDTNTFLGLGGHAAAGGFSVEKSRVENLSNALNSAYEKLAMSKEVPEEVMIIDALLTFDHVSNDLNKELEKLEPCGEGNPKPTFSFRSDGALLVKEFGKKGGHFELMYPKTDGTSVKAIYFFGEPAKLEIAKDRHTLIAQLEESHFGWKPELRLRVIDITI